MERRDFIGYMGLAGLLATFPTIACSEDTIKKSSVLEPEDVLGKYKYNHEKCVEAWEALINGGQGRVYEYVTPNEAMKKVFLYGDSISLGYTVPVRDKLLGMADVYRLYKNGGASDVLVRNMENQRETMFHPMLKGGWHFDWDVIHFNVGLHDLKYVHNGALDLQNGTQVSSHEQYTESLRSICEYLRNNYPQAKLIFATTTPVPEGADGRIAGDAAAYNEVALRVMEDYPDIEVNDLYSLVEPQLEELIQSPGNVHYKPEGSVLLGEQVASVISKYL